MDISFISILSIFDSPLLAKVGQACQNMIIGLTLSIYTKRNVMIAFLMDGIQ